MSAILLLIALLAAGHLEATEPCKQKMDLCLVLDGSSTVCGGDEPCTNWEFALKFNKKIAAALDIGPKKDRVAFVTFTNTTEVKWDLEQYTAKKPLLSAIGRVAYNGGEFYDKNSTNKLVTEVFNPASGDNMLLKNVVLVMSDGVPALTDEDAEALSIALDQITFFVVCITTGCTESFAKAAALKPEKVRFTSRSVGEKEFYRLNFIRRILSDYTVMPHCLENHGQFKKSIKKLEEKVKFRSIVIETLDRTVEGRHIFCQEVMFY